MQLTPSRGERGEADRGAGLSARPLRPATLLRKGGATPEGRTTPSIP